MVALKTERQVFMWHMEARTLPKDAPVSTTLTEVLDIVEGAWHDKTARIYLSPENRVIDASATAEFDPMNCLYISDLKKDSKSGAMIFLINRGDPDASNPAFIKASSQSVRAVPPEEGETQGWSAHLVLSTTLKEGKGYRACFEKMPNVSSGLAQKLFETILDGYTVNNAKYVYDKVIKRRKKTSVEKKPYRLRLTIKRVPSEKIIQDLEKGELSYIQLIKEDAEYNGPGAPNVIKSTKSILKITTKDADKNILASYVRRLEKWARENKYDEIQFKMVDLPGNGTASPRFALEQTDAMESLYARSQRLTGFSGFLERCYEKIHPEIEKKVVALLKDKNKW